MIKSVKKAQTDDIRAELEALRVELELKSMRAKVLAHELLRRVKAGAGV